jgi:peroxiredoxin
MKVGFIGLGHMGAAMAGSLLQAGHDVTVYNRTPIVFVLPDYLRDLYKSFGGAPDRFHDESEYRLPIPARYVIDKKGIIRAADVNADYAIRPEPSETVRVLRTLTA